MLLLFIAQIGCSLSEFDCGNGVCIPFSWRCDTDNDCNPAGPSIDEQNCKSTIPMVCCPCVPVRRARQEVSHTAIFWKSQAYSFLWKHERFWLRNSGICGPKLHCGNVVSISYYCICVAIWNCSILDHTQCCDPRWAGVDVLVNFCCCHRMASWTEVTPYD